MKQSIFYTWFYIEIINHRINYCLLVQKILKVEQVNERKKLKMNIILKIISFWTKIVFIFFGNKLLSVIKLSIND